jgi:hypothetical protein
MRTQLLAWSALGVLVAACASQSQSDTGATTTTSGAGGTTTTTSSATGSTTQSGTSTTTTTASGSGGASTSTASAGGMAASSSSTASASASSSASGGNVCQWAANDPCGKGFYCDAPGCGMGTCKPLGKVDDAQKKPVCGCDNVDYWNAATAEVYGMAVKAAGICASPKICGGIANLKCPQATHFCGRILEISADCKAVDMAGTCWGMPKTCSQLGFGGNLRDCVSPKGACKYECDAIKSGSPHYPDNTCPM